MSMKITDGLPTTFDVYIPANISLGEVHKNSGLEGADQKPMNEQVRDWLTTDDFKDFATNMGHHGLSEISQQVKGLQELKSLTEENAWDPTHGQNIPKLKQLIASKPPMSLFYCSWSPNDGGTGHASNVSVAHNNDTGKWEVTFHNTGLGSHSESMQGKKGEKQTCPCAYVFSGLDDGDVEKLLGGILHIQEAGNEREYQQRCQALYKGKITYKDGGNEVTIGNFKKPKDPIHNYTFVRAQVGGNCTYASLNAMMRYLVLKQCGALHETTRTPEGKKASSAARALDFYCRMKSIELAFANVKMDDPQGVRFLERMLEANVCYFKKYVEKRCGAEANGELEKIRGKFAEYREKIHQAKIGCGTSTDGSLPPPPPIPEKDLWNANGIVGALPAPAMERRNRVSNRQITTNPELQRINKSLGEISGLIAQNEPQATRKAVKQLAELCSQQMGNNEHINYVGDAARSLILNKNFRVDIGEALRSDGQFGLQSLEDYHKIAKFLYVLKEKNGKSNMVGKVNPNKEEQNSIDEQNVIYTLQAHSLQIYREAVRRRNEALRDAHPHAGTFDPAEIVIYIPEIRANDHCYDGQSVDRRAELSKFSCSWNVKDKFVIGSLRPDVPKTAEAIFNNLLSGEDHGDFLQSYKDLNEQIGKTSESMAKSFEDLKAIKVEILKAQKKEKVLGNLNTTLQALKKQKEEISRSNPLKSQTRTLENEVRILEDEVEALEKKRSEAERKKNCFHYTIGTAGFMKKACQNFNDQLKSSLENVKTQDVASKKKAIVDAIKKFIGEDCLTDEEIANILEQSDIAEDINNLTGDKIDDKIDYFIGDSTLVEKLGLKYGQKQKAANTAWLSVCTEYSQKKSQLNGKRMQLENAQSPEAEKKVSQAITAIESKIAAVRGWPDASKADELKGKRDSIVANINNLAKLRALQLAATVEFYPVSGRYPRSMKPSRGVKADFDGDEMGFLRNCTVARLENTRYTRDTNRQNVISLLGAELDLKTKELHAHNPLAGEFSAIADMVESVPGNAAAFRDYQTELNSDYKPSFFAASLATDGGAKLEDLMTSSDQALGDAWGQEITINREILDFDSDSCLKTLRKIPQHGNRYAKTVADVVGYEQGTARSSKIFDGTAGFTNTGYYLDAPSPYAVCGLGDLAQFVAFNKIFQALKNTQLEPSTSLDSPKFSSSSFNPSSGGQFAPGNFAMHTPAGKQLPPKDLSYGLDGVYLPDGAFKGASAIGKSVEEGGRNGLIVGQNSTSLAANLKKCNVMDVGNPLDFVLSVLAAIGNRPSELVDQLKMENTQDPIDLLVMGLLTSPESRGIISNGIITLEDAQKLAEGCINFLNQTWFQSSRQLFTPGEEDQKHILSCDLDRIKAMALCVTAIAEVLAMPGQEDGIDPRIKAEINKVAQQTLENILDSLNEKVLFQNVKNEKDAAIARREIAQLKLHLANQQSKLVGGSENLSAKWCANVIASLAECGGPLGRWAFSNDLIGADLRRFCSDFAIGFAKHVQGTENHFFLTNVTLATKDIIEHSRQPPELTPDALASKQEERTKINYANDDTTSFFEWDADSMCLRDGTGIICDITNGASDIVKKSPSHRSVEILIADQRLRSEVCEFFGIKDNETVKSEEMTGGTIKIEPTSGIHKGEVFFIKNGNPSIFKKEDGAQLLMVAPENMKYHLFRNHFCWGTERNGKVHYEFFERMGRQEVAYCAINDGGQTKFARGRLGDRQTIDPEEEIMFLDFKEIPGLSHLCQGDLKLGGIFDKKNDTIELTTFQYHGNPIKLQRKGEEWVLASNPRMKLISHEKFTDLLEGERGAGLGNTAIPGTENPMGFGKEYLVFQEDTSGLASQNFMFLIPEEVQDEGEAKNFFDSGHKAKEADKASPYGLFGRTEPSKLSFDENTLTVRTHFLRWSRDKVGRYGEFAIPESDPKAITHSAIALIARAMREKNYTQALGFLNAIPNGLMLGKSREDDAIRKMFLDIIRDNFDNTPLAAAIHMRLFLKWLQMDTGVKDFVDNYIKDARARDLSNYSVDDDLTELVKEKFVRMWREEAYYPPSFALTPLEKKALLEKLPYGIFVDRSKSSFGKQETWKEQQRNVVADLERKRSTGPQDDTQAASVVTRSAAGGNRDSVSEGERNAFFVLRENFSSLNPRPNPGATGGLLEGEDGGSKFTFLGTEQRPASESPVLNGEFDRYEREIEAGREKVLENMTFIPADKDLAKPEAPDKVKEALEGCRDALTEQQRLAHEGLKDLYGKIFSTHIAAGTISSDNMMPILVELMLDRGKPPMGEDGGPVTLNFLAQNIQITIPRDQYKEFLAATRSYLLTTSILQKNELIDAKLRDLQRLQALLRDKPDDSSLIVQTRAVYLALNREIAAQQELYTSDESNNDFYGKVAEAVGPGITRDELMVYESLSGIRPYDKQAMQLKDLFAGNIKAFQLIMGGGKTAVLLSILCFHISRRDLTSEPLQEPDLTSKPLQEQKLTVESLQEPDLTSKPLQEQKLTVEPHQKLDLRSVSLILAHSSQFESLVGNVGEYQRSRFGQGVMVLDVSRSQLKDVEQLEQILGNLQAAKKNRQVIIAKTSLLNVLQLTFQEACAASERRNMLQAESDRLQKEINVLEAERKSIPRFRNYEQEKKLTELTALVSVLREQQAPMDAELEKYKIDPRKFELLREILWFLQTEPTGICDEADMNFNVQEEVNFPSGREKPIPQPQRSAGSALFRHIADVDALRGDDFDLFGLLKNEQAMLSDAQFREHQDILAEHIWTQNISPDEARTWGDYMVERGFAQEDFKKILMGEPLASGKDPFKFVAPAPKSGESESLEYTREREILERLAIFRGLTAELLQQTRNKSANRNYGFAIHEVSIPSAGGSAPKMERQPVFVPYVAVGQPSQNAFGNPYEKMACFFMHAMHNESPVDGSDTALVFSNATGGAQILDLFFKKIQGKIELEKSLAAEGVAQTVKLEDLFFKATGVKYVEFKEAIEKRDLGQPEAYNALLGKTQKHLANNPHARLLLFEYVSDEFLRFHPAMTTSGSMQIPGLVGDLLACSGTVWNHKTWPTDLDKGLKEDVGTEGQILIKQKQDFLAGRAKTFVSESAEVERVLDTIGDQSDLKNFRALIDTGGIFKTSNAETVARKMLVWVDGKNKGRSPDDQIKVKGVLFFRPHEDRAGGAYCIMSADKPICVLSGTTKDDIQKAGFDPDEIAVYYDEARTVGTDVKFRPTAFALQTNDPSSTTLRDLSQGSMRMRQLLEGQRVYVAIPKSYVAAKRKAEVGAGKTEDSFTFEEILKWGAENQAKKLKKQEMKAHKAKIDGIFKDIILEAMQDKRIRHEDACQIYGAFVSFFQKEMQTDPIAMFAANKTMQDGEKEIEIYYAKQLEKFLSILKKHPTLPMAEEIASRIEEAQGTNGKLAQALEDARTDLRGEEFEANENTYDANVEENVDQEQEQEQQTEVNQEREQDVDQERDVDLNYSGNVANRMVRREEEIDVSIDPNSPSFAHFRSFESVSAREDLQRVPTNRKFTNGPAIRNYGELLPDNFHVSRNFMEVVEGDTHPLSPFRKEPTYVVLHITPDNKHEFCVVSNGEAKKLQKNLKGENVFLYGIHGNLLAGDPTKARNFNAQKEDALNWIHFWHGDVEPLRSASSEWIEKNLKKRDPEKPMECSNHEVCCFRWLLARSSHGNTEKLDNRAKEVHSIFQSAGVGSELQAEAENLFAGLGFSSSTPKSPPQPAPAAPKPATPPPQPAVTATNLPPPVPPPPPPTPVTRPTPDTVSVSVGNQEQMKIFGEIIGEIPQRRNAPWYSRLFAFFRSLVYGTSTNVELTKMELEVKDSSREGGERVTTLGKRFFEVMTDKKDFLEDAFGYIYGLLEEGTRTEEAIENTKFLLYFCREYLSSPNSDQEEVEDLKRIIISGVDAFGDNPDLRKISTKICGSPR